MAEKVDAVTNVKTPKESSPLPHVTPLDPLASTHSDGGGGVSRSGRRIQESAASDRSVMSRKYELSANESRVK